MGRSCARARRLYRGRSRLERAPELFQGRIEVVGHVKDGSSQRVTTLGAPRAPRRDQADVGFATPGNEHFFSLGCARHGGPELLSEPTSRGRLHVYTIADHAYACNRARNAIFAEGKGSAHSPAGTRRRPVQLVRTGSGVYWDANSVRS